MVFGPLLSAQDGVQIESSWDRAYEGYLALSASTHHYRILKKWASVDRKGVYGLMGHVQRNRDVENLLGDAEYAQAGDVVSSSAADQLRKRKFQDDRLLLLASDLFKRSGHRLEQRSSFLHNQHSGLVSPLLS